MSNGLCFHFPIITLSNLMDNILNVKIHSSCEIEDFVEKSSLQAVCDTPIARITVCVLVM